jgi:hypothetical protein
MPMHLEKFIIYFGQPARVACDGRCSKAWGINSRPRVQVSQNEDDYAWKADGEFGEAPANPGTYEGGQGKPRVVTCAIHMNKWCVRECERCVMTPVGKPAAPLVLRDFSRRVYNIPRSGSDAP